MNHSFWTAAVLYMQKKLDPQLGALGNTYIGFRVSMVGSVGISVSDRIRMDLYVIGYPDPDQVCFELRIRIQTHK